MPRNDRSPSLARLVVAALNLFAGAALADARPIENFGRSDERYWVEEVVRGLRYPSSIAWLPGGDALIVERHGGVRLLHGGKLSSSTVNGVPPSNQTSVNGLKDIILDPDFARNETVYLLLSEGSYEKHHAAVYRAQYRKNELTGAVRIFKAGEDYNGGAISAARMLLLSDQTLLIAVPEPNYYKAKAQRLDSHVGKIVRINLDGSTPGTNPFLRRKDALPDIWSYGHRVQSGLYQDRATGEIWEVEIGPAGGDELNLLRPGANFGWANVSWGFDYSESLAAPHQYSVDTVGPILVWMRSPLSTPSGLVQYRGGTYPEWDGDFFVGHLAGRRLERLRIVGGQVVLQETMISYLGERIRDVKVGPDDHIYVLTDHQNGRLLRLKRGVAGGGDVVARKLDEEGVQTLPEEYLAAGDAEAGKQVFLVHCASCHSVGTIVRGGDVGPDLLQVFGRKAGSLQGFPYSSALLNLPQVWDTISLTMFISSPQGYAPGTSMLAPPLSAADDRRNVVSFLKRVSGRKTPY